MKQTSTTTLFCLGTLSILAGCVLMMAQPRSLAARQISISLSASIEDEIDRITSEIDRIEAQTQAQLDRGMPEVAQRTVMLGKLLFYDKQLSVHRNEACAFCHMPEAGF